jgi:hypothetical protein
MSCRLWKSSDQPDKAQDSPRVSHWFALDTFVNTASFAFACRRDDGDQARFICRSQRLKGGGAAFHFHQDNQCANLLHGPGSILWTALSPMTEENELPAGRPALHLGGTLASHCRTDGQGGLLPEDLLWSRWTPVTVLRSRLTVHVGSTNVHGIPYRSRGAVPSGRCQLRTNGETWKLLKENPRYKAPVPWTGSRSPKARRSRDTKERLAAAVFRIRPARFAHA